KVLLELIGSTSPWQRSAEASVSDLLGDAARKVPERLREQPAVLAELLQKIGEAQLHAYRLRDAEPLLRKSLELRRRVFGRDSLEASDTMRTLAVLLQNRAEDGEGQELLAEAERLLADCVAIHEQRR